MWSEPLTGTATQTRDDTHLVTIHAGDGLAVATVMLVTGARGKCVYFGEMNIHDPNGGPRQVLRAMALLVRTTLEHAAAIGVEHGATDVPDRANLRAFAEHISGVTLGRNGELRAPIERIHTHILNVTDADGNDVTLGGIPVLTDPAQPPDTLRFENRP